MIGIKHLRELLAKATPGPWHHDLDCFEHPPDHEIEACVFRHVQDATAPGASMLFTAGTGVLNDGQDSWIAARKTQEHADAALIATLVNAAPELLDRLELLENRLNTYQREWHEMEAVADAARAQWQDADARHHETLKRAADLEAKLAAAEERAANLLRETVSVQDELNERIAELEAEVTRAVKACHDMRAAGPAFPHYDIATRFLSERGELVEWEPKAKAGQKEPT